MSEHESEQCGFCSQSNEYVSQKATYFTFFLLFSVSLIVQDLFSPRKALQSSRDATDV
jgi:hypothetical protein